MPEIPFFIVLSVPDSRGFVVFDAQIDGVTVTSERFKVGDGDKRCKVARVFAKDARLQNGQELSEADTLCALEQAERDAVEYARELLEEEEVATESTACLARRTRMTFRLSNWFGIPNAAAPNSFSTTVKKSRSRGCQA